MRTTDEDDGRVPRPNAVAALDARTATFLDPVRVLRHGDQVRCATGGHLLAVPRSRLRRRSPGRRRSSRGPSAAAARPVISPATQASTPARRPASPSATSDGLLGARPRSCRRPCSGSSPAPGAPPRPVCRRVRRPAPGSRWSGRRSACRPSGDHPGQVGRETAAGDVREGVHLGRCGASARQSRRVDLASAPAAPRRGCGRTPSTCGPAPSRPRSKQDVADQRVPVASEGRRTPWRSPRHPARMRSGPSSRSASTTPVPAPGDVEVVRAQQTGVLGRLAAHQGAAGQHTALGDALHDRRRPAPGWTLPTQM